MRTINQSTALTTLIERALPSHSGVVKYNHSSQMYETERYVSAAGNAYFRGLKISDRVVLEFCCGDGIWHRFINCIRIYCFNGNEKQKLLIFKILYPLIPKKIGEIYWVVIRQEACWTNLEVSLLLQPMQHLIVKICNCLSIRLKGWILFFTSQMRHTISVRQAH